DVTVFQKRPETQNSANGAAGCASGAGTVWETLSFAFPAQWSAPQMQRAECLGAKFPAKNSVCTIILTQS
ncbi:hypothetical protein L195_g063638, partial [Trifolium pratense]